MSSKISLSVAETGTKQTFASFQIPDNLPNSFLDAVRRYGTSSNKAPAVSVVDHNGKIMYTLLYGTEIICLVLVFLLAIRLN